MKPPFDTPDPPGRERPASDDYQLVRKSLAGDVSAEEALIQRMRCIGRILGALNRRAGRPLSEDEIDDLTQDVFRIVWTKRTDYEGDAALETWVYRFCQLTFLNRAREVRRRRDRQTTVEAVEVMESPVVRLFADDASQVMAALHELPSSDQQLVEEKLLGERSFPDLASDWGVSANTLKTRYYRAMDRMRDRLRVAFGEGA